MDTYTFKKISSVKNIVFGSKHPDGYDICDDYEVWQGVKKLFNVNINGVNLMDKKPEITKLPTKHGTYATAQTKAESEKAKLEADTDCSEVRYSISETPEKKFEVTMECLRRTDERIKEALKTRVRQELANTFKKQQETENPYTSPTEAEFTMDVLEEAGAKGIPG